MATLGPNRYGKAEVRLVRIDRPDGSAGTHQLHDLNVSVALSGNMEAVHLTGSTAAVLPTDSQKNTVYAFAKSRGVDQIEDFAQALAEHFVATQETITGARVAVEEYGWDRITVDGKNTEHSFVRNGSEVRTCLATYGAGGLRIVSGVTDLVVLNSAGSEFAGYIKDEYTTLEETTDRVLATAVTARWRHRSGSTVDYAASYAAGRTALLEAFASTYSLSLQQTLFAMGERILDVGETVEEVRLSLPNKHHFVVDLSPFGLDNPNEVFHADDRPYGLVEGTVLRDGVTSDGPDW